MFEDTKKIYIKNFAAESFAFLMRKIQDKDELFAFLFARLQDHPTESYSIAKLVFEMFKGVKRQFNSCTEHVSWCAGFVFEIFFFFLIYISFLFQELKTTHWPFEQYRIERSVQQVHKPNHSVHVWIYDQRAFRCCLELLLCKLKLWPSSANDNFCNIYFYFVNSKYSIEINLQDFSKLHELLILMKTFVEYQNGYLISNIDLLINKLCLLTSLPFDPSNKENCELIRQLFDLCRTLILSENVKFPIEKIRLLICKYWISSSADDLKWRFELKHKINRVLSLSSTVPRQVSIEFDFRFDKRPFWFWNVQRSKIGLQIFKKFDIFPKQHLANGPNSLDRSVPFASYWDWSISKETQFPTLIISITPHFFLLFILCLL